MIAKTLYWSGRALVNGCARAMLHLDVQYHAPLPAGAKIIAPNHPTTIDPFLSTTLFYERAHILISETLFKVPLFSAYLRHSGHIPVLVRNRRAAFDAALRLLQMGKTVVIFPEGALSPRSGGLGRLHTGVARLALLTNAPVIPVGIGLARERIRIMHTTVDQQPETAYWYFRGPYAVTVGAPLYFKGSVDDHPCVLAITDHIRASIQRLASQSDGRVRAHQLDIVRRNAAARRQWQGYATSARATISHSGNTMKNVAVNLVLSRFGDGG